MISRVGGRWTLTVDDVAFDRWYVTQAAAWEAGVREADRLDALGTGSQAPGERCPDSAMR